MRLLLCVVPYVCFYSLSRFLVYDGSLVADKFESWLFACFYYVCIAVAVVLLFVNVVFSCWRAFVLLVIVFLVFVS